MIRQARLGLFILPLASFFSVSASAHSGGDVAGGFVGGFVHPFLGLDHMAAMVAVGLWGAILGQRAIIALPVAFPLVMVVGGILAIRGLPLPGSEIGVAISAIALGAMIAFAVRAPLLIAGILVGTFAVFHGHAHGAELPPGTSAAAFSIGFVLATGLLHLSGIALGGLASLRLGRVAVRAMGALIAAAGAVFLWVRV